MEFVDIDGMDVADLHFSDEVAAEELQWKAIVGTLDLHAQYARVAIGNVKGNASIRQQYGPGLDLGSVDNLNLDAQYVTITFPLDRLTKLLSKGSTPM